MLTLRPIKTIDSNYLFVENLFVSSFPIEERRDLPDQRRNIDSNTDFTLLLAEDGGMPVGFFTIWDFGDFSYCEHFATAPTSRNKGYGSRILELVLENLRHPLVLEVELPDNDLSRRRISFYQRHGFKLMDTYHYTQPPYRCGGASLPMHLMVYSPQKAALDLNKVATAIHARVYTHNS